MVSGNSLYHFLDSLFDPAYLSWHGVCTAIPPGQSLGAGDVGTRPWGDHCHNAGRQGAVLDSSPEYAGSKAILSLGLITSGHVGNRGWRVDYAVRYCAI